MNIRHAQPEDANAIAVLLTTLPDYPRWQERGQESLAQNATAHLAPQDNRDVLVAELEGVVVAYVAVYWMRLLFNAPEGYISELFVHHAHSGKGVGTALLREVESLARAKHCGRLTLINLADRVSYQRGFYAKHGFKEQAESRRFVLQLEPTRSGPQLEPTRSGPQLEPTRSGLQLEPPQQTQPTQQEEQA